MIGTIPLSALDRLSAADLEFVCRVLAPDPSEHTAVMRLLAEPVERDTVLGHPKLLEAVISIHRIMEISPELYFHVVVRHGLGQVGIDDAGVIDYIAATLAAWTRRNPLDRRTVGTAAGLTYQIDFLNAFDRAAGGYERFHLCVHSGNQFLILTGLFPGFIRQREVRRGAPGVNFYENAARGAFRSAGAHPLADEFDVRRIYGQLSDCIHETRLALNKLADEYLTLAS